MPIPNEESRIECSLCGRVGGVYEGCDLCHGATRFNQTRHYTLTEERQGKAPDDGRYTRTGATNPTVVNLPGSFNPYMPTKTDETGEE
jgi:hypothetical protein